MCYTWCFVTYCVTLSGESFKWRTSLILFNYCCHLFDLYIQNTVYDGEYHARHPNIITFWEAFEELTDDQKKAFLLFLTGCERVPILGMDKIQITVAVLQNSTELHFPESHTCYFLLFLPIYPSKEMLLARLKEAVAHNRGFWKE
ncbi:unnamed protein product [Oncorhynchus mykiss]|uniref:HECT-type E3 ubiquitin transferase n=1 Tax=Oncorhynchus mykiss TaxID=8022 RepID=A0A060ZEY3_ONCMY|nr:unnamed protein product [Oncorhynchus mykiss]